jgi:hypothetical protein
MLTVIYFIVLAIGILVTLISWRKIAPAYLSLILLLFSLTLSVELIAKYVLALQKHSNLWLLSMYVPIECLLFSFLYFCYFREKQIRYFILTASGVLVTFSVINILWIQGINDFNTYSVFASGGLILTCVFYYFRKLLRQKEYINPLRDLMFWISTGLLFFYAGNIFIVGTINYFNEADKEIAHLLVMMIKLLDIIMFSLIIISVLCQPRQKF